MPSARGFSRLHPAVQLLYLAVVLLVAMFSFHPLVSGAALLGGVLSALSILGGRETLRRLKAGLIFGALVGLLNPLFVHRGETVVLYLAGRPLTLEAFWYGLGMGLMLAAVLLWFSIFSHVMNSTRLHFLLSHTLPGIALLFSMTLRFFPLFLRRIGEIRAARAPLRKNEEQPLKESMRVFSGLSCWALEHAAGTTFSMAARGYGAAKRTSAARFRLTWRDALLAAATALTGLLCAAASAAGLFTLEYYPGVDRIVFSAGFSAALGLYLLLCCLPAVYAWGEEIVWRCSLSNM